MTATCPWCGGEFPPATRGRRVKRFCSNACRNAYHAAARRWVHRAIAAGLLSVADLKAPPPQRETAP